MAKWDEQKVADLTRKLADTAIDYKQRCEELEERLEAAQRDAKEAEAYAEELEAKLFSCATDLDIYMSAHASLEAKLAQQDDLVQAANRLAEYLNGDYIYMERVHHLAALIRKGGE